MSTSALIPVFSASPGPVPVSSIAMVSNTSSSSISKANDSLPLVRSGKKKSVTYNEGVSSRHVIEKIDASKPEGHPGFVSCIAISMLFIAATMLGCVHMGYSFTALEILLATTLEVFMLAVLVHEGISGHFHS